jgi:hypothetical protein
MPQATSDRPHAQRLDWLTAYGPRALCAADAHFYKQNPWCERIDADLSAIAYDPQPSFHFRSPPAKQRDDVSESLLWRVSHSLGGWSASPQQLPHTRFQGS